MKLVVLAAGKGTRFYPLTKEIPKGLIPLAGKPLLEHVLEPYLDMVSDIIFVINDQLGLLIEKHFGPMYKGHAIQYVVQTGEHHKGTLSALSICQDPIGEDIFCVSNCDDLLLKKDVEAALQQAVPGIGISPATMPWNYLGIDTKDGFVTGFRRHDKAIQGDFVQDNFSNGFHVLTPEIFSFIPAPTSDGELGLPQTLFANIDTYPLKAFEFKKWQAVNGPDNIAAAEEFINTNNM